MTRHETTAIRAAVLAAMERKGMTQTELAKAAQTTQPNVSDWLKGKANITDVTLGRILKALGLKIKGSE